MEICKNMATVIMAYKKISGKSNSECAQELEISCSALKEYISGQGNPSAATLEHLSRKLGVDPVFLISGLFTEKELVAAKRILEFIGLLAIIPPENQHAFTEQFISLIKLAAPEEEHGS